jgi:hypothetical protein
MKKRTSHHIGHFLAQVQDTCDLLAQWGFGKLKSVAKQTKKEDHPIKRAAGKVGSFMGEVGDTFYKEYEKLKQDRENRSNK